MIKQAPSVGRILTMVAFALSCFGILIFLWLSFGGSVPLQPEGYRVNAQFPEATQLAQEAEVRISGVKVGKVRKVEPDNQTGLTDAVLEIDARYAPLAKDTRAMLRQKTLLGETYVEVAPGSNSSGMIPDGGKLPQGQVADTVQLDEILRTFDPETRARFSVWLDQQGRAALGNGEAINDAIGNLTPFAENTDDVLKVLRAQGGETRRLIRDTGVVFHALSERQGQLRSLIRNSNTVWGTTARRNAQLADTFRVLPTFLRESRTTTTRLTKFADDTNPLIDQLRPAARELSPTLQDLDAISPDLKSLFHNIAPLVKVSKPGLPAATEALNNTRPVLGRHGHLPAPVHPDRGLPRALQEGDRRLLRQRRVRDRGAAGRHPLPPDPEPDQPGDHGRLSRTGSAPTARTPTASRAATASWPASGTSRPSAPTSAPRTPCRIPRPRRRSSRPTWSSLLNYYTFGGTVNRGAAPPCDAQAPLGPRTNGGPGVYPRLQPLP